MGRLTRREQKALQMLVQNLFADDRFAHRISRLEAELDRHPAKNGSRTPASSGAYNTALGRWLLCLSLQVVVICMCWLASSSGSIAWLIAGLALYPLCFIPVTRWRLKAK